METRIIGIEREAGRLLDDIGLPRHELAAENVLLAIRLELPILQTAQEQRDALSLSIAGNRSGLLHNSVELVAS